MRSLRSTSCKGGRGAGGEEGREGGGGTVNQHRRDPRKHVLCIYSHVLGLGMRIHVPKKRHTHKSTEHTSA